MRKRLVACDGYMAYWRSSSSLSPSSLALPPLWVLVAAYCLGALCLAPIRCVADGRIIRLSRGQLAWDAFYPAARTLEKIENQARGRTLRNGQNSKYYHAEKQERINESRTALNELVHRATAEYPTPPHAPGTPAAAAATVAEKVRDVIETMENPAFQFGIGLMFLEVQNVAVVEERVMEGEHQHGEEEWQLTPIWTPPLPPLEYESSGRVPKVPFIAICELKPSLNHDIEVNEKGEWMPLDLSRGTSNHNGFLPFDEKNMSSSAHWKNYFLVMYNDERRWTEAPRKDERISLEKIHEHSWAILDPLPHLLTTTTMGEVTAHGVGQAAAASAAQSPPLPSPLLEAHVGIVVIEGGETIIVHPTMEFLFHHLVFSTPRPGEIKSLAELEEFCARINRSR